LNRPHIGHFRLLFAASIVVPLLILGGISTLDRAWLLSEAGRDVEQSAAILHEHALKVFETHELILKEIDAQIAHLADDEIRTSSPLHRHLEDVVSATKQIQSLWVTDAEGKVVASSRHFPAPTEDLSDRDYFRALRDGAASFVSDAYKGRLGGHLAFRVARRRSTPDGTFNGVIFAAVHPEYFLDFYQRFRPGKDHTITLFRKDGAVLVRSPSTIGIRIPPSAPVLLAIARSPDDGVLPLSSLTDGVERIGAYREIKPYQLYVYDGVSRASVLAVWYEHLAIYGLVTLIVAGALAAATWVTFVRTRREQEAVLAWQAETRRRTAAELRVRQIEKMQALGTLAGGIAHNFNNLMLATSTFVEMSMDEQPQRSSGAYYARQALAAIDQAREVVRQIMTFSRQDQPRRTRVALAEMVRSALPLLAASLPGQVRLTADLSFAGEVLGDATQLQQILLNLGSNAIDAIGAADGRVGVSLRGVVVGAGERWSALGLAPGPHACLVIEDDGCGMDEAVRARIFEPFFTTKEVGRGTGMGLSIVHGIVRAHDGAIEVESAPGRGTRFLIYLPVAAVSAVPALAEVS
jgi:signal transduction histidine kinase